jgi:hypothetical protein
MKAQAQLRDPVNFENKKEQWIKHLEIDEDLIASLCRQDFDKHSGKLVDSTACSYFGHSSERSVSLAHRDYVYHTQ